jgi:hypothetical protein
MTKYDFFHRRNSPVRTGSVCGRVRVHDASSRSPPLAWSKELATRQVTSAAQLSKHEVELHDIARVADAKLQTKLAVMDEMVLQADREIERLESLLEEIRDVPTPRLTEFRDVANAEDGTGSFDNSPVEPDQFIRLLRQSGYNPEEIANATKRPVADIRRILGEPDDGQTEAA